MQAQASAAGTGTQPVPQPNSSTRAAGEGLMRHLLLRLWRELLPVDVCRSSPEPEANWRTVTVDPVVCLGRYEGTERLLGRREHRNQSLHSSHAGRKNLKKCVVQPRVRCTSIPKSRQDRLPRDNCAKITRQKKRKNRRSGVVYPLTAGSLLRVRRATDCCPISRFITFRVRRSHLLISA